MQKQHCSNWKKQSLTHFLSSSSCRKGWGRGTKAESNKTNPKHFMTWKADEEDTP